MNKASVEHKELRLAQISGPNLMVHAEELEGFVEIYEYFGYFDELILLFKQGLVLERAHMGMFIKLGILYSKYRPEKLMNHLKFSY